MSTVNWNLIQRLHPHVIKGKRKRCMEEALILVSDILKQFCVLIYMYTCEHTSIHSKHLLYYMYSFQRFSKLCVYVGGGGVIFDYVYIEKKKWGFGRGSPPPLPSLLFLHDCTYIWINMWQTSSKLKVILNIRHLV